MHVSFPFEVMSNVRLMKKSFPFLWGFPLATSDPCVAGDAACTSTRRRGAVVEVDGQGLRGALTQQLTTPKWFKSERSTATRRKEKYHPQHKGTRKMLLLGSRRLGKASIYQREGKKPLTNRLVNAGVPAKLRDDARPLQLDVTLSLQKNAIRDCLLLYKGINAQE